MTYINPASIHIDRATEEYLRAYKDENEPWVDYLRALLDFWLENNEKIDDLPVAKNKKIE